MTLIASSVAVSGCWFQKSGETDGPLHVFPEHGYVVKAREGRIFTDGFDVVRVDGDAAITIKSVNSVGGEDTLGYLGARIAGPHREVGATQVMRGFPPSAPSLGRVVPAVGATLKPRSQSGVIGYELLLGYKITDNTLGGRATIKVVYESDGRTYESVIHARLVTCPGGLSSRVCMTRFEALPRGGMS